MGGPVYRHDPFTDGWVIVAPERSQLLTSPDPLEGLPSPPGPCPFCPGNEAETEPTVQAWPPEGDWDIRVVRNRYPMVTPDIEEVPLVAGGHARVATGVHEVIIETRAHEGDLPDFDVAHLTRVLEAYRERNRALVSIDGVRQVSLFRNRGLRAGSSQPHPHAQILASSVDGREQATRWRRAREHYRREGETLLASVLAKELRLEQRIVLERDAFVVLCPFAPWRSYETWVVPRDATGSYSTMDESMLAPLADALQEAIRRTCKASGRADYNLVWRQPPARAGVDPAAFWFVQIIPGGRGGAGLELTSGLGLSSVTPEDAATRMRD